MTGAGSWQATLQAARARDVPAYYGFAGGGEPR